MESALPVTYTQLSRYRHYLYDYSVAIINAKWTVNHMEDPSSQTRRLTVGIRYRTSLGYISSAMDTVRFHAYYGRIRSIFFDVIGHAAPFSPFTVNTTHV